MTSRLHYGELQYKVQWLGWDKDPTWYPAENFKNSPHKLRQYHEHNPNTPGPPIRLEQWRRAFEEDRQDEEHADDNKAISDHKGLRRRRRN